MEGIKRLPKSVHNSMRSSVILCDLPTVVEELVYNSVDAAASKVPCILGINLTTEDLVEYIEQHVETDGSSTFPPSVLRTLNFKSCKGAIMFGDPLLRSECFLILEELKATSLCFQCAHGRPTTVPLISIFALWEQLARLEMQKGEVTETWLGFRRHRPDWTPLKGFAVDDISCAAARWINV